MQRYTKRDASLALRNAESGVADQVMLSTSEDGQKFVKVRVRTICIPQVCVGISMGRGGDFVDRVARC